MSPVRINALKAVFWSWVAALQLMTFAVASIKGFEWIIVVVSVLWIMSAFMSAYFTSRLFR